MSGICGIVHIDGAPVDRQLLQQMTAFMTFRGPDAQDTWANGAVGFGHTLLRTTFEAEHEQQPLSLDGTVWITADARIDGQAELKKKLEAKGRTNLAAANDAELILHAYHAWGEDCVSHLIGDFAFAIWDGPRKQLFCARDHFGVRPFFYARTGNRLIFSNTLNCVRQHPAVSDTLNDLSIADHLLFEFIQDPTATAFADIQRLAPAQYLVWTASEFRLKTYWTLPDEGGVRYRPAGDYVEHFQELLNAAVSDRLRSNRISVEMSGGLDSTSVTAVALAHMRSKGTPFELEAYTMVFDHLFADPERRYAELAAKHMGIPIHYSVADDFKLFESSEHTELHRPEPVHSPVTEMDSCTMAAAQQAGHRVVLTGWDGDNLLNESPKPYFRYLFKQGKFLRCLAGMARYAIWQRRLVPLSFWDWLYGRRGKVERYFPTYPAWLNPELEQRLDLRSRWEKYSLPPASRHPIRPAAYYNLAAMIGMSSFFDFCDAGVTHRAMEFRHPLLDLRVVDYCLSLPPFPWCVKKEILRESMRGGLPDSVRLRPKTSLRGEPLVLLLAQPEAQWIDRFVAFPALSGYLVRENIPPVCGVDDPDSAWRNTRPLSLDIWLRSLSSADK
jgi:asparagine synthase (glutamine-hydrolysing)